MLYRLLILLSLSLILIFTIGCSKKSDEAAELEKEFLGDTVQPVMEDSTMMTAAQDSAETFEADAQAVPEEEVRSMPKQPAGAGYSVQVAGCEDQAYAEHLVDVYTRRGYEPFVTNITIEGQTYYRVRIGLFESYSQAKAMQAELLDKYSLDTWIDEVGF